MPSGSSFSQSSHGEGENPSSGQMDYRGNRSKDHGGSSSNDHHFQQQYYGSTTQHTASSSTDMDASPNMAGIGSGSAQNSPRIPKRMPGQNLLGTPVMTASSSVGHASDAGRNGGHEKMGRSSESASAPTSPHLSRPGTRGGASYSGPSPSGFSPNLSTRSSRHSLRYETTHQARQPSHDSSSSHQHHFQQQQPYTNSRPQHQSRPSITSSNSQHQSNLYLTGQQTGPLGPVAGRQQSFERQVSHYPPAPEPYRHQTGQSISSPVGQAPYSASATMSSALPSDWQGTARVPTRSATDPSSPYLVDNAPRSQDSNGHGTPRADSQSVFANQQVSTPRASANERSVAPDQGMQQQQYASGLRIIPPPPIPPLSPSRQLRQSNRGRYQGTPGPMGLAAPTSNLAIGGGDAGRRTMNGPNPSRSPTTPTYATMGEQQQQAQYTRRAMNVPLPPSESSHQGHHPSEAERREQAVQGDSAVVENAGSDAQQRSRQESTVTNPKALSFSQPPVSSGAMCGACGKPVKGQYVRAMGKIYHLECFKCRVSPAVVALSVRSHIDRKSPCRTAIKWLRPNSSLWTIRTTHTHCVSVTTLHVSTSYAVNVIRHFEGRISLLATENTTSSTLHAPFVLPCSARKIPIMSTTTKFVSIPDHSQTEKIRPLITLLTVFQIAISTIPHDSLLSVSVVRTQS